MLKVAPCTVVRSHGRTTKFFGLDGLLLFCIVMGLRSASSATITLMIHLEAILKGLVMCTLAALGKIKLFN